MATPVQMPKQGNSVEECLIVEWSAKVGQAVSEGDLLCTIETDKASFEVTAPASGKLLRTFFDEGELAPVLINIAVIGEDGEDADQFAPEGKGGAVAASADPAPEKASAPAAVEAAPVRVDAPAKIGELRVSPRARSAAAEKGIDPAMLQGSGPHGRVTSSDIAAAASSGMAMTPAAAAIAAASGMVAGAGTGLGGRVRASDLVEAGSVASVAPVGMVEAIAPKEVKYTGIRKLIGERMMQSLENHAQLTLNSSADASALLSFRKKVKASGESLGLPNITLNDMVCMVVAKTLPRFPELNAIFDAAGERVLQYSQVRLAVAVDTPRGLMVPVVNNAHAMTLSQLALSIADLAGQCKGGSIDPDLLQGGTFTITNLGSLGVESFTPVINTPQVAILGICSIEQKAVPAADGAVKWQPTMGLSLTIDHKVVDGAPAARFLRAVADGIANFDLLLA
ncbi:MAG: 2-oxo acid dehydrogenase subunit E2 [Planctomycetes bacterium]|nr:2-oxo acid dehydrogenase subunit E2 [Planctomycetota bacterium]